MSDNFNLVDKVIKGYKEEDETLEFKLSFFAIPGTNSFNNKIYDQKTLNRLIAFQSIKAIIGFMNSNGGRLIHQMYRFAEEVFDRGKDRHRS